MIAIIVLIVFIIVIYIGVFTFDKEERKYNMNNFKYDNLDKKLLVKVWECVLHEHLETNTSIKKCIINACWTYKVVRYKDSIYDKYKKTSKLQKCKNKNEKIVLTIYYLIDKINKETYGT